MPTLIELPEALVRSLAAEHLGQDKKMQKKGLERVWLLWAYGSDALKLRVRADDYLLAKRLNMNRTTVRLHRMEADRIMQSVLSEARAQAIITVHSERTDDPPARFEISVASGANVWEEVDTTAQTVFDESERQIDRHWERKKSA